MASRLAHESTVLLQNKKTGAKQTEPPVLPLDPKTIKSIAVIGPNADAPRFGNFTSNLPLLVICGSILTDCPRYVGLF